MSPSFILPLVLQSALLPFGVALAILAAMRRLDRPELGAALAVPLALLASYFAIHRQWSPLPQQALDWLPWIGLLAVAAALGAGRLSQAWARAVLRLATGCVAAAMSLAPILMNVEPVRLFAVVVLTGVLLVVAWTVLGSSAASAHASALVLAIVAGGAGLTLMIDASQSLGQLNGALAMACTACFVFALVARRTAFDQAAAGIALVLLAALLVNAHVYAGFSLMYVTLLLAGLAGGAVPVVLRAFGKNEAGIMACIGVALVAGIPVLAAIGLVLKAAQESGGY